jgi:hypothetical protein
MGQSTSSIDSQLKGFIKENCAIVKRIDSTNYDESAPANEIVFAENSLNKENILCPTVNGQHGEFDVKQTNFVFFIQGDISNNRVQLWIERLKSRLLLKGCQFSKESPNWLSLNEKCCNNASPPQQHVCVIVDSHVAISNIQSFLCKYRAESAQEEEEEEEEEQCKSFQTTGSVSDSCSSSHSSLGLHRKLSNTRRMKRTRSKSLESSSSYSSVSTFEDKVLILKTVELLMKEGFVSFHTPDLFTKHLLDPRQPASNLVKSSKHRLFNDSTCLFHIPNVSTTTTSTTTTSTHEMSTSEISSSDPVDMNVPLHNDQWFYSQSGKPPPKKRKTRQQCHASFQPTLSPLKSDNSAASSQVTPPRLSHQNIDTLEPFAQSLANHLVVDQDDDEVVHNTCRKEKEQHGLLYLDDECNDPVIQNHPSHMQLDDDDAFGLGVAKPYLNPHSFACQQAQPQINEFNNETASTLCQVCVCV